MRCSWDVICIRGSKEVPFPLVSFNWGSRIKGSKGSTLKLLISSLILLVVLHTIAKIEMFDKHCTSFDIRQY